MRHQSLTKPKELHGRRLKILVSVAAVLTVPFLVLFVVSSVKQLQTQQQLIHEGVSTKGTVVNLWTNYYPRRINFTVSYYFNDGATTINRYNESIGYWEWKQLHVGSPMLVTYLPSDPSVNVRTSSLYRLPSYDAVVVNLGCALLLILAFVYIQKRIRSSAPKKKPISSTVVFATLGFGIIGYLIGSLITRLVEYLIF